MALLVKIWRDSLNSLNPEERVIGEQYFYHSKVLNLAACNVDLKEMLIKLEKDKFVEIKNLDYAEATIRCVEITELGVKLLNALYERRC